MSRNKALLAGLVLTAIVCLGVMAQAQTVKVMIAGSSAQWQTLALGTYNDGKCPTGSGATAPCMHYTYAEPSGSTVTFQLTDGRPTPPVNDPGSIWIVWDSASTTNVWAFIKVDSGVGNRCYFANPACLTVAPSSFPSPNSAIKTVLWGDSSTDQTPPTAVQNLFATGVKVNVAATDIRPEDSYWSTCRTNSISGNGLGGDNDGTDGLGYNTINNPGTCPPSGAVAKALTGNAIQSGLTGSTSYANVVAFNITGTDPFNNTKPVPKYTTYSVGAAPIVFVYSRNGGQLKGLTNATDSQLEQVFSGTLCDASAFGLTPAGIAAYLRESLSGTMNTTEATVFRRPTVPASAGVLGMSQETGVNGANPLTGGPSGSVACPDVAADGVAGRWRGIGTGEAVKSVLNSVTNNGIDGIAYSFFSYGNIGSLANSLNYGYITLNGTDPIFSAYYDGTGSAYDPGQPTNVGGTFAAGILPAAANLPSACVGTFPCPETEIWKGGLSFPNVRSGSYRAWSLLRVVSTGTALTQVEDVIKSSQAFVVTSVPDYIPATSTKATINSKAFTDPGLTLIRSHYQQTDGNGTKLGSPPVNAGTKEAGGDMGGCVESNTNLGTQLIQSVPNGCVVR